MTTLADHGSGPSIDPAILRMLRDAGLIGATEIPSFTPLTGGVASDIWKVDAADDVFVVKQALSRLRVAQEWNAPISRNASEVEWIREAGRVAPHAVPDILAHGAGLGAFAMTYFDPAHHAVWKKELMAGRSDAAFAAKVGATIAAIHAATAGSADVAARFANDQTFHAIRLEPYIEATARAHSDLATTLVTLSRETMAIRRALVHGDVSPKNILMGPDGPVILDAECAWFGDPAFDLAFCLNHLLLKGLLFPAAPGKFIAAFDALTTSYLARVTWEPVDALEYRAARLLPALLLARIDGKSPVEYIETVTDKNRVRQFARPLILSPLRHLGEIGRAWIKG
jgi:aminoglycoside phosphotransferase (APT) family kinase protein